jgi:hypothetical protein
MKGFDMNPMAPARVNLSRSSTELLPLTMKTHPGRVYLVTSSCINPEMLCARVYRLCRNVTPRRSVARESEQFSPPLEQSPTPRSRELAAAAPPYVMRGMFLLESAEKGGS